MRIQLKNWHKNLIVLMISFFISITVAEVILRLASPHEAYFCSIPNVELERRNKYPNFFNIDSNSHYSVNQFGYRSPSFFSKDRYGILTVGGSTTDCIGLADNETWPWILEEKLNKSALDKKFTVGNIGVPAFNSFHHILQVERITPQFENIRMVVMLVGVNDFSRFLHFKKENLIPDEKELLHQTFVRHPRSVNEKWYEQTELWAHTRDAVNHIRRVYEIDNKSFELYSKVAQYDTTIKITSLPDLTYGMEITMNNVLKVNQFCSNNNIKLVVITQPVLWHKNMSEEEIRISSYGKSIKNGKTYSDEAMAEGMNIFNNRLITVAQQNNFYAIDLAKTFPKTTTVFFDHCHYNKIGSQLVSKIVFKELEEILKKEGINSSGF